MSHRAHAVVLAAAIASGCQALDSAIPRQPAIPDIPFAGDRPDAPPLEQRGNGTFLFASYDPSGKYLVTVTLEDQLQVSVYDVSTGARLGRHVPAFENWEGSFKVSDDGSRIVIYKFVSDTFEVLDGNNATRLGFVCPYFCNLKHNPADSPYAVSPDGRSVAISQRRGTAIWDTATDTITVALRDPLRKPLPYPYEK